MLEIWWFPSCFIVLVIDSQRNVVGLGSDIYFWRWAWNLAKMSTLDKSLNSKFLNLEISVLSYQMEN